MNEFYASDDEYKAPWDVDPGFEPEPDPDEDSTLRLVPPASDAHVRLPNFSVDLYKAHPLLQDIRSHAHSRIRAADSVLLATLTAVSASIPGGITIDTGIGSPTAPGLFTVICADSGGGKTTSVTIARKLTHTPSPLTLSTGEGLLEAFYGTMERPDTEDSKGKGGRSERIRTKSNILFYVDEGETLYADMNRDGSKLGGILRSFWSGADTGTTNASAERNRQLEAGTYNGGLIVGMQTGRVGELLGDVGTGMAQRFLWCSTIDPTIDRYARETQGALFTPPDIPMMDDGRPFTENLAITVTAAIREELITEELARQRGNVVTEELDAHKPVMLLKISATLAWMDGRLRINEDDWELAKRVLDESNRVRDALLEQAEAARKEEVDKTGARIAAVKAAADNRPQMMRAVRKRICELLARSSDPVPYGKLRSGITKRGVHRELFPDAIEWLLAQDPPLIACHETPTGKKYGLSLQGRQMWEKAA